MAVFFTKGIDSTKSTELVDKPNVSINSTAQMDNSADTTPSKTSIGGQSDIFSTALPKTLSLHNVTATNPATSFLYGQLYIVYDNGLLLNEDDYTVSIGYITETELITFGIWNSHGEDLTISSIDISQPSAIGVTGAEAGGTMLAKQELEVTAEVLYNAPAVINCTITFELSNGDIQYVTLMGVTAIQILMKPQMPFLEYIQHYTNVLTASNGKTQRRNLRKYPRKNISMQVINTELAEQQKLANAMMYNPSVRIGIAQWQMQQYLGDTITAGDLSITIDTTTSDYYDSGSVFIYDDDANNEVLTASEITDTTITFETPVLNNYANPKIMPYRHMRPVEAAAWEEYVSYSSMDIELTDDTPVEVDLWEFAETYNDEPIFPYACNIFESTSQKINPINSFYSYDSGTGLAGRSARFYNSKIVFPFGIHAKTRSECWQLRQIIYALKGMQTAVWVNMMSHDFVPYDDEISGNTINIEKNNYDLVFNTESPYRHICIQENGADSEYREITGVEEFDNYVTLTLDSSISTISTDSVKISYLVLARLTHDAVEIEWINPNECECKLEFIAETE